MYVWTDATPDRDGDLDNGIIIHEYGHGVSNRLTGGPAPPGCLNNQEQGGEGWSDYLGLHAHHAQRHRAGRRPRDRHLRPQPADQRPGIRTKKYSTDMAINDHTYDSIKTMVAPHGVGEVWAAMLWELTYALIDQYGFDADLITGNAGNNIAAAGHGRHEAPALQSRASSTPATRSSLRTRRDYGGANQCLIWDAVRQARPRLQRPPGVLGQQGSTAPRPSTCPRRATASTLTATATPSPVPAGQQLTYSLHLENTVAGRRERRERGQSAR